MVRNRNSVSSRPPLYLAVGDNVELVFEKDPNTKEDRESRLVSICITMNKLSEILNNGLCTKENIWDIEEIELITRTNFLTKVNIPTKKKSLIISDSDQFNIRLDPNQTKKCAKVKKIFEIPRFTFFVDQAMDIRKKDLFIYHSSEK